MTIVDDQCGRRSGVLRLSGGNQARDTVDFRLLGPLEVVAPTGRLITFARRRDRCLLATLVMHDSQLVSMDRLVELLWDGVPPSTARAAVQTSVSRVRSALRRERVLTEVELITQDEGYLLRVPRDRVDVHRFRALVARARATGDAADRADLLGAAVALWRGDALADAATATMRDRLCTELEELRLTAIEDRATAELELGRHGAIVAGLAALVAEHPYRERLVGTYLLALHRGGRTVDALEMFQQWTVRLRDELGIEPGAALRELHVSILRDDARLDVVPPVRTVPRPAPAQLPAGVPEFTGRQAHLRELHAVLDAAPAVPTCLIVGTAGVGKTALAVRWAHEVRARFPDGQLFVDLAGYSPAPPVPPLDALSRFLRTLGGPGEAVPYSVEEAAAAYRTRLADSRTLIVLDNAGDVEQVRPLLPGTASCLVVVTSRDSLTGLVARHGGRRIRLDPLTGEEAVDLLRTLAPGEVGAEPAVARTLADRCAGLPFALRLAAERVASRPGVTPAELAADLADERLRLDRLDAGADPRTAARAVFSWSYRRLSAKAARTFRRVGLHPGREVDAHAVAALDATDPVRAAHQLDELTRAHLVVPVGPDRFAMHDLLRAYAAERAAKEDSAAGRHAALTRLFDHYLAASVAAIEVAYPHDGGRTAAGATAGRDAALAWLAAERGNLVAVAAHCAAYGWATYAAGFAAVLESPPRRRGGKRHVSTA